MLQYNITRIRAKPDIRRNILPYLQKFVYIRCWPIIPENSTILSTGSEIQHSHIQDISISLENKVLDTDKKSSVIHLNNSSLQIYLKRSETYELNLKNEFCASIKIFNL
jgi:hypothetical protein